MIYRLTDDLRRHLYRAIIRSKLAIPFYESLIPAGFTSPAENYIDRVCDLNDLCINEKEATYFGRVCGDSMIGDSIFDGDIVIIDATYEKPHGRIVVVSVNGENTLKRIYYPDLKTPPNVYRRNKVVLVASNPKYVPIYVHPEERLDIIGVVTWVLHKTR